MKAKVIEPTPEFKPVTLELTFETKEELYAMLAVVNRDPSAIWKVAAECDWRATQQSSRDAWGVVSTNIFTAISKF